MQINGTRRRPARQDFSAGSQTASARGPSSALRSAFSAADGVTRYPSPRRSFCCRSPFTSCRCTSVVPGCAASTSRSRSTSGGVQRPGATLTMTGPCAPIGQIGQGEIGDDQLDAVVAGLRASLEHDQRVLDDLQADLGVGGREEQHLDRALEVLERRPGPRCAGLGHPAADRRQDAGDGHRADPLELLGLQGRDRGVGRGGQDVLDPEQRMVRDVEAQHLAFEGQQDGLVPFVLGDVDVEHRRRRRCRLRDRRTRTGRTDRWPRCAWCRPLHRRPARTP